MEKLTNKDMNQLEQWIGTGPKKFELLYKISRDGCSNATFHAKCNNQGPTATVLYNQQGSVFGGYASVSWASQNTNVSDTSAFMFRLHYNGKAAPVQFTRSGNGNEIYDHQSYGPVFGSGNGNEIYDHQSNGLGFGRRNGNTKKNHRGCGPVIRYNAYDLTTFSGTIQKSSGYFDLNGNMDNFGYSFTTNGLDYTQLNNDNMTVTDLEVYRVTEGKRKPARIEPWRKTPTWNDKLLNRLMEDVIAYKGVPELGLSEANILLIGPVGAGKSSFYNTINSIFRGRITQRAGSGNAEQSLTTSYKQYRVRSETGTNLNFRLCDTRGLEEDQGLDILELNYLLEGHVPDFYQFNPASPITPDTPGFVKHPSPGDKIHCVAFVVDVSTLDVVQVKILQKIKSFQAMMNQRGIPQVVLLTKVDKLSSEVEADISKVFQSTEVKDEVDKASQTLGLPRVNILPVKNYENEMEPEESISILALLSLRQILNFAEDYMENVAEKLAADKKSRKQVAKE